MKSIAASSLLRSVLSLAWSMPRATLLVWVGVAAVSAVGVVRLHFETSTDSLLSRSDPAWAYYRQSVDLFGGDEIVVVALEAPAPFERTTLARVRKLTEEIERVPGVRRVDSLSSVANISATPDGALSLSPVLARRDAEILSDRGLAERVFRDRLAPRTLVSDDGRVFAINVLMEDLGAGYDETVVRGVRAVLAGQSAWITGGPVFRTETNWRMQRELTVFVPVTVMVISAFLFALFRTLRAVFIPLATAGLGCWVMLGSLGATGTPFTISTMILPSILLALGSAYVMHLLVVAATAGGPDEQYRGMAEIARPIALSGLTTAIGFLSMNLVRIESIQYLGTYGAIGVLSVLAATLSVAPACLRLWPLPPRDPALAAWIRGPLSGVLARVAVERRVLVLGVWASLAVGAIFGASRIEVETDVTRWFPVGTPIRDAYEEIRTRLSGISPMNVVIEGGAERSVSSSEVIKAIDGLDRFLESLPQVGKVVSVADPLRQLHGGFVGDAALPLPPSDESIAQYLILLESVEQLSDVLTLDHAAANVMLRVDDNGSLELLEVARLADQWWREWGPEGTAARTTGIMYEYARAEDEIAFGQLRGLLVALGVIGVLLLVIFGDLKVAAAALLPNAVPIAMAFGAMGLLSVPLDAGTVSVGCLALGIAVDDTIHLVTAFRDQRALGLPSGEALRLAFQRLLPALAYTTLAVAAGFAVLGGSGFLIVRNLGLLTAVLMVLCLVADGTLLATLLVRRRA